MVDLLMTIIIILITSILPKLKAIQARPARMKLSAPAPGFEATVDWVGVGGVLFSYYFVFFSLLFLPTCQLDWSMTTNPKNQKKLPIPRIHSDFGEAKPTTLELVIRALLSAS